MSLRAAIRRILAGLSALVVVPMEVVVAGVRTVSHMLVPKRNTESLDVAEQIHDEGDATDALAALAAARAARDPSHAVRLPEPERVRRAAEALRGRRPVSSQLFDRNLEDDAEVMGWLETLDDLHLAHVVRASDEAISEHLAGNSRLPIPLLPADERRAEEMREAARPLSEIEWIRVLIARKAEAGEDPDGDQLDDIILEARQLAESNAVFGDHLPRRVLNEDSSYDEAA